MEKENTPTPSKTAEVRKPRKASRSNDGEPLRFVYILREKAGLIFSVFLLAALGVGAYLLLTPEIYMASVVFEAAAPSGQAGSQGKSVPELVQALQSSALAQQVAQRADLREQPEFQMPEVLRRHIRVVPLPGSRMIRLEAEHTSPLLAQQLANAYAEEFLRREAQPHDQQLREIAGELQKKVEELRLQKEKSTSLWTRYQALQARKVPADDLQAKLAAAQASAAQWRANYEKVAPLEGNMDELLRVAEIANHSAVKEVRKRVTAAEEAYREAKEALPSEDPQIQEAHAGLEEENAALRDVVLQFPALIKAEYVKAEATRAELEKSQEEWQQAEKEFQDQGLDGDKLRQAAEWDTAQYEAAMGKLAALQLPDVAKLDQVSITDSSRLPTHPVRPDKQAWIILGLAGGLLAGILIALLADAFDSTLRTVHDTQKVLDLPVIGAIPLDDAAAEPSAAAFRARNEDSPMSESFRSLRAYLELLGENRLNKTVLFTSAVPSEGKSFCCANYAIALANAGFKTLLVDGDLRRPVQGEIFYKKQKLTGLTDFALGLDSLEGLAKNPLPNLHLLAAGTKIPNPAELLTSRAFQELLAEAEGQYDRIVIDSAPVNAVGDTLMMVPHVGRVCLVVRAGQTPRKAIVHAIGALELAKARPVGAVLNCLPERGGSGYYYHYSEKGGYNSEGVYGAGAGSKTTRTAPALAGKK